MINVLDCDNRDLKFVFVDKQYKYFIGKREVPIIQVLNFFMKHKSAVPPDWIKKTINDARLILSTKPIRISSLNIVQIAPNIFQFKIS